MATQDRRSVFILVTSYAAGMPRRGTALQDAQGKSLRELNEAIVDSAGAGELHDAQDPPCKVQEKESEPRPQALENSGEQAYWVLARPAYWDSARRVHWAAAQRGCLDGERPVCWDVARLAYSGSDERAD